MYKQTNNNIRQLRWFFEFFPLSILPSVLRKVQQTWHAPSFKIFTLTSMQLHLCSTYQALTTWKLTLTSFLPPLQLMQLSLHTKWHNVILYFMQLLHTTTLCIIILPALLLITMLLLVSSGKGDVRHIIHLPCWKDLKLSFVKETPSQVTIIVGQRTHWQCSLH